MQSGGFEPVNFRSIGLDELLIDLTDTCGHFGAKAVVILGPDVASAGEGDLACFAVYPPAHHELALRMAASIRLPAAPEERSPLVGREQLNSPQNQEQPVEWKQQWLSMGIQTVVRYCTPLANGREFQLYLFCENNIAERSVASEVVFSIASMWNRIRTEIGRGVVQLTDRQREFIKHSLNCSSNAELATKMKISMRTVSDYRELLETRIHNPQGWKIEMVAHWLGII
jgi:hypothetical protein